MKEKKKEIYIKLNRCKIVYNAGAFETVEQTAQTININDEIVSKKKSRIEERKKKKMT